ncbi:MAG TPA: hypothetical protein VNK43_08185 [Gemmatimonadales bacterium]|nr:hypothetical protein [Gemmatimonadales bacterium]
MLARPGLVALVAISALGGCVAAAAGAGAAAGIYLTSRGAESLVRGSTDEVVARTRTAFSQLGIEETGYEKDEGGDEQELRGTKGDLEITVGLEREGPTTTRVEVVAKRGTVQWDKDYAKDVLSRIVDQSPGQTTRP